MLDRLEGTGRWPIFKEISKEGAYPATVVELAEEMPSQRVPAAVGDAVGITSSFSRSGGVAVNAGVMACS
jgi:hypothetical protein